mgnify:CR=1 FL=1
MPPAGLKDFATRYASAWSSQNPSRVAAFFEEHGALRINGGPPSSGRAAIEAVARSFMTAFPDMAVSLDQATGAGNQAVFHWTLTGTNTGPGGSGHPVRISGREEWTFGPSGRIAESDGHFDESDYRRQLEGGPA